MQKKVLLSILSLGVIFIALLLSAPDTTETKRYFDETEDLLMNIESVDAPEEEKEIIETEEITYVFYEVTRVVDGDTVKIMREGKEETLRLIGMNTPETVDPRTTVECFGKEASNKVKELLSGKRVRLEFDEGEGSLDKYGRTLAYIYTEDGVMFNQWMIENGYAYEYTYDSAYKYQTEFKASEKYARDNELGLWGPETCSGEL